MLVLANNFAAVAVAWGIPWSFVVCVVAEYLALVVGSDKHCQTSP